LVFYIYDRLTAGTQLKDTLEEAFTKVKKDICGNMEQEAFKQMLNAIQ